MSGFIGGALSRGIIARDDQANLPEWAADRMRLDKEDFSTPWWPGSGFVGDLGADVGLFESAMVGFEGFQKTRGRNSRLGFVGVTRDVYGSPLGGVTVKLFRTSDDVKLDQIVSDPSGNYLLSTPYYPDQHYLVFYKTGSPDVMGASVNTLIGA